MPIAGKPYPGSQGVYPKGAYNMPGRNGPFGRSSLIKNILGNWRLADSSTNLENGTIVDSAGHAYTFSAPNTAIISASNGFGNVNPVADFHTNAAGDPTNVRHFQSADAALTIGANGQWTAACWVNYFADPTLNTPPLVSEYTGTTGWFLGNFPAGKCSVIVHDNTGTAQTVSETFIPTIGVWCMIAGGWDGTKEWVQVNNRARITNPVAQTNAATAAFSIGNYATGVATIPLNGYLADVCLWNRTLSAAEILRFYNNGAGTYYPFGGL